MKVTAASPAPPAPPPAAPAPPTAPAPAATWPEWFGPFDWLLAGLAVALAFLAASFAARNSDLWLHLATGRALVEGKSWLGVDPFGGAVGRPWVNTAWLTDLLMFGLYRIDPAGGVLVAAKAAAFALAWGLLFLLRRRGESVLPWAFFLAVGALAATPAAVLRPTVLSLPMLAGLLVLVARGDWSSRWRLPVRLGVLTAVWANCDSLAVLAPFALALLFLGERLQRIVLPDVDDAEPTPPAAGLGRALLLSVAALALNPTFLGALAKNPSEALAQLVPAELGWGLPPEVAEDADLFRYTITPLSNDYLGTPLAVAPAGVAAGVVAVGSLLAMAAGFGRLRATHIVLWIGFAILALQHYRLIGFFAVVAAPLAAAHCNGLGRGLRLGTPTGNLLGSLSGVARIVTLTALIGGLLAAWPGWLHAVPGDRALAQRVAWGVEPDAGLKRAAGEWRRLAAAGPGDVRFLAAGADVGDTFAWFAPESPAAMTSRLRYHRHDLAEFLKVRRALKLFRAPTNDPIDTPALLDGMGHFGADALILGTSFRRLDWIPPIDLSVGYLPPWPLWHLDGRVAVVGRPDRPAAGRRFDPVRLAFGPDQEPLPTITPTRAPPAEEPSLLELWFDRPAPLPVAADDALIYAAFAQAGGELAQRRYVAQATQATLGRAAVAGVSPVQFVAPEPPPADDARPALPLLAVRAARRAIAAAPERFDAYQALLAAWQNPETPGIDEEDRRLRQIAARAQLLERLATPEPASLQQAVIAAEEGRNLAFQYAQTNQFDFARPVAQRALRAAKWVAPRAPGALRGSRPPAKDDTPASTFIQELDALEDQITREVSRRTEELERRSAAPQLSQSQKFRLAADVGLPDRALKLFQEAGTDDFGPDAFAVAVQLVNLELRAGRLADAASDFAELRRRFEESASEGEGDGGARAQLTATSVTLQRLLGNSEAAAQELAGAGAGRFPPLPPAERQALAAAAPFLAQNPQVWVRTYGAGVGMLAILPLAERLSAYGDLQGRVLAESDFYANLGVLALYGGKTTEAANRFRQALQPQGQPITAIGAANRAGEIGETLRLLNAGGTP